MEKLREFLKANRGAQTKLAAALRIYPSAISQWQVIPVEHLPEISVFTGIPREELAPHVFREARDMPVYADGDRQSEGEAV